MKTRRSKRSVVRSKKNSRRTCVRSFSPILTAQNASLFCNEAWLRGRNEKSKQNAGALPNTVSLLLDSPNVSNDNKENVRFLWNKFEEFRKDQMIRDKQFIANGIWSLLNNIQSSYMNNTISNMHYSPTVLTALGFLFDELILEFEERIENPVKSCKLLPGKFGKPMTCPEKNSATLQKCISDYTGVLREAKRLRKKIYESTNASTGVAFIEKVMEFFRVVQGSNACASFERVDNFAKNKGKYMKGHIALFRIMAGYYMRQKSLTKSVNSNNSASTISNASSITAFSNSESNYD